METKLLIVDDDPNICDMLKLYFENEGYKIRTANDGVEGVQAFKMYDPDLVLLDIMMPKKDGWQVCREIREMSPKPVIMITAKGEVFDKVLGLELGADDFIVKPFDMKELSARIKAVLRRYNAHSKTSDDEIVKFENIEISLQKYELTFPQRSSSFSISSHQTATEYLRETSFLIRFGDLITSVTQERLTYTLSAFVKSLKVSLTSGFLRPFGALATNLKP